MSGGNVGFAFQTDVANTGSLVHLLTDRALKALSDGGVDFYSVVAAVTLGKSFTVRNVLGNTVRSHIMSSSGIQYFLSKALSIGWGHSGLAIKMTNTRAELHLTRHGDASGIASTINQLMVTSQKGESIYMIIRMRGAWFSALAAHILGMSVELRLNKAIVWATARSNGIAILELSKHHVDEFSIQTVSSQSITLVDLLEPENQALVSVSHSIGDVFTALVDQEPRIDVATRELMRHTICCESFGMARTSTSEGPRYVNPDWLPGAIESTRKTLGMFGLESTLANPDMYMYAGIMDDIWDELGTACDAHQEIGLGHSRDSSPKPYKEQYCVCAYIQRVISGVVFAVIALDQCRLNTSQVRIREHILLEEFGGRTLDKRVFEPSSLMKNIMLLVGGEDMGPLETFTARYYILGLSSGGYTVYYTSILQNDCYDAKGRLLTLLSGRASLNDTLRSLLWEERMSNDSNPGLLPGAGTSLALGADIEPYHNSSDTNIYLDTALSEKAIVLRFSIGLDRLLARPFSLKYCLSNIIPIRGNPVLCTWPCY